MASIGQLLRGSDNAFFDLFERAGANVVRAAELLDALLSGFPESQILARDILVCDFTEEVADYLGLYRIEAPMLQAQALAHVLLDATRHIETAIPLVRDYKNISEHTVEIHRLENEGDRIVRGAIASLFEEGIDPMVVIRWKDIFELLEDAIDATERVAFILEGIVIKNA